MTPSEWVAKIKEAVVSSDWDSIDGIRQSVNQPLAEAIDVAGLRFFYDECLALGLAPDFMEKVRIESTGALEQGFSRALARAKDLLAKLEGTKGIYVEYYFDGAEEDTNTANVFLCTEYSEADDEWGAMFTNDGFVAGPSILEYLNFDPDWTFDDVSRTVSEEYGNAIIMSACLSAWQAAGINGLPLGFANHDHSMVRSPAI